MLVQDDGVSLSSSQAVIASISTIAALCLAHWFTTFNLLPQCLFLNLSIFDINSKLHRLLHRKLSLHVLVSAHPRLTWSHTGLTSFKVSVSCRLGMGMSLERDQMRIYGIFSDPFIIEICKCVAFIPLWEYLDLLLVNAKFIVDWSSSIDALKLWVHSQVIKQVGTTGVCHAIFS